MNIMITIDGSELTPGEQLSVQYHWSVSTGPTVGGSVIINVESDNIMNNNIIGICVAEANADGFPVNENDTKILIGGFYTM